METAEVVVGCFFRRIMTVDDTGDVLAHEDLSLVETLLVESLDE
jgi:hypothetical protein